MGVRCYVMWILIIYPSFSSAIVYVMDCRFFLLSIQFIATLLHYQCSLAFVPNFNIQIPNHA